MNQETANYIMQRMSKYLDNSQMIKLLETARKRLRKEQNMSFDVTVKTIPERYVATVQMVVSHYEDEGMLWNTMMSECKLYY